MSQPERSDLCDRPVCHKPFSAHQRVYLDGAHRDVCPDLKGVFHVQVPKPYEGISSMDEIREVLSPGRTQTETLELTTVIDCSGMPITFATLNDICRYLNEGRRVTLYNSSGNDMLNLGMLLMAHYERMKGKL